MELIHNFLSIPFEPTMEVKISNWLSHGHYIHAIDYERNCVLVFNIPHKAIAQLISLGLCDYDDFSYKNHPNPPKHYVKLFRYVDWFLFENIGAYRWFAQRQDYRAFSPGNLQGECATIFRVDSWGWMRRILVTVTITMIKTKT